MQKPECVEEEKPINIKVCLIENLIRVIQETLSELNGKLDPILDDRPTEKCEERVVGYKLYDKVDNIEYELRIINSRLSGLCSGLMIGPFKS